MSDCGAVPPSLLELQNDPPEPGDVLDVAAALGVEVAELGNPLPLGAGTDLACERNVLVASYALR